MFSSEQRRSEATMNLVLMPAHDSGLRDAMRKVGGFNPHFGRVAATLSAEFDLAETEAHQLASYWGAFFGMWCLDWRRYQPALAKRTVRYTTKLKIGYPDTLCPYNRC